ncbi:MAG: hypothetical protein IKO10_16060 [Lachnospiraceae bacterium]|nr:hypothetical protein [Lachnospiraceae bacterium]
MAEENKEWSKAFTAFKEFKDAVMADPANAAEGTHTFKQKDGTEVELPNKNYNVSNFQNYKTKEGKDMSSFTISKFGAEQVKINLSKNGVLASAEYTNWTGVEKGALPAEKEFVGKDFEKLSGLIKDPLLKDICAKLDWTKVQGEVQQTAEAAAPEAEDDKEM